jgi:hypothetical protein
MEPRRIGRALRAWIVYRLDQTLGLPPLVQVLGLTLLGLMLVAFFAWLELEIHPRDEAIPNAREAVWWTMTHFMDGGTMASDMPYRRGIALTTTAIGILIVSLLTAALASKMGERITDLRSGLNPVVERNHVLVLGFDPNVPLVAREFARSGQRITMAVLANVDKDRIEASLRGAHRVRGKRLKTVVRTGDPRAELALLRVSAQRARAAIIVPPQSLTDQQSVEWSLGVLLALRRVVGPGWQGRAFVVARHEDAIDLLRLAAEPDVAGPGALIAHVVAADAVIGAILAQSTREEGVYFALRHLLAFDGCELYLEPVPKDLVGKSFDYAHASLEGGLAVGIVRSRGEPELAPARNQIVIEAGDRLVVISKGHGTHWFGARLPAPQAIDAESIVPPAAEDVAVIGFGSVVPHLIRELGLALPVGSTVHVVPGDSPERGGELIAKLAPIVSRIKLKLHETHGAQLTQSGHPMICGADAVVILGEDSEDDQHGDASALAMLLRMRHGLRARGNQDDVRVVTEVRDPRSAAHVAPRHGDCIVSSDVVAMLLAQEVLEPEVAPIYRQLLSPGGAYVAIRARSHYLAAGPATFADLMASARAQGDVAIGLYPHPHHHGASRRVERRRLEEGDPMGGDEAWLNPPRETAVPESEDGRIVVLTRYG